MTRRRYRGEDDKERLHRRETCTWPVVEGFLRCSHSIVRCLPAAVFTNMEL